MKEKLVSPLPGAPVALVLLALVGLEVFSIGQLAMGQLAGSFFWVPLVLSGFASWSFPVFSHFNPMSPGF